MRRWCPQTLLCAILAACSEGGELAPDAAPPRDAGSDAAALPDAQTSDASAADAGSPDGGIDATAPTDAGDADCSAPDAAPGDAGPPAHCANGVRDANELGDDCGGACAPCVPCTTTPHTRYQVQVLRRVCTYIGRSCNTDCEEVTDVMEVELIQVGSVTELAIDGVNDFGSATGTQLGSIHELTFTSGVSGAVSCPLGGYLDQSVTTFTLHVAVDTATGVATLDEYCTDEYGLCAVRSYQYVESMGDGANVCE
jgi:hypothetical protein